MNSLTYHENTIKLGQEYYLPHLFYRMDKKFANVDPQQHKLAVARNGGPIAVGINKNEIVLYNSDLKNSICFYSNSGELKNKIGFEEFYCDANAGNIVCFQYIEDELLFILISTGKYYLFNPFKDFKKEYSIVLRQNEYIVDGQVFDNGFVFLTNNMHYYFVHNVYEPMLKDFPKFAFTEMPRSWLIVSPEQSDFGKLEIHVAYQQNGITVISEDGDIKHFFGLDENKKQRNGKDMPVIQNIQMMCQTVDKNNKKKQKQFAYLTKIVKVDEISKAQSESWDVWIISDDFQQLTMSTFQKIPVNGANGVKVLLNGKKRQSEIPIQMLWCGFDSVMLVFTESYMNIGHGTFTVHQPKSDKENEQQAFCTSEIDGVRILTKRKNVIFRKQPQQYTKVKNPYGNDPVCKLRNIYESYQKQEAWQEEDIRKQKEKLCEAVKDSIKAGTFELKTEDQGFLLKTAAYGKTFLNANQINHDILFDKCKYLRVIYNMSKQGFLRTMTYKEAKNLREETFVKILLRYNLHHLAFEVCNYLNFKKKDLLVPMIYEHWACCKVEQNEDDAQLCMIIKDKLANQKGLSFTEIAHRAIEKGKPGLAIKLLDLEPEKAKRVPVLLSMAESEENFNKLGYYEKALEEALLSRDSNFINMVILHLINSGCEMEAVFQIVSQNLISSKHFIEFLRHFDLNTLESYLNQPQLLYTQAFQLLRQASNEKNAEVIDAILNRVQKMFKGDKQGHDLNELVQLWIVNIEAYLKRLRERGGHLSKTPDEIIINNQIANFIKDQDVSKSEIQADAKTQKVSERTLYILKVKELVAANKIVELTNSLATWNKKKTVVPYELVADLFMQQGDRQTGIQFLEKIPEIKDQINVFLTLNEPQRAIDAILKSNKSKGDKKKYLERLMSEMASPQFINIIQQEIENLKKK